MPFKNSGRLGNWNRTGRYGLEWSAGLGGASFTAPFFAGLLVILAGLEELQDPFALEFLLQTLQGLLNRLIFSDIDF